MRIAIALALLAALAWAQAGPNAELARKLKERKIQRFFSRIEKDDSIPAVDKAKIMKLREGGILGGEYGAIHQALLSLHPDYKRADELLLAERLAAAVERFDTLRQDEDEYVAAYSASRR